MKKTGELLKRAREQQRLSLSEVSLATKISLKVLQAMEEGNRKGLPANTFLRGFLKSYALYLKLDTDEVLKQFADETGGVAHTMAAAPLPEPELNVRVKTSRNDVAEQEDRAPLFATTKRTWLSAAGIILLIGMIITIQRIYDKYNQEGQRVEVPEDLAKIPEEKTEGEEKATKEEDKKEAREEAKPTETKTAETKTAEAASTETKPAENKTAETKPAEPEAKPAEVKPEPKPEVKPVVEAKPVETKPVPPPAPKPVETKVAEVKPVEPPKPPPPAPTSAATPAPASTPTTAAATESPKGITEEIIIEALDKVDVTFKINNGPTERISLNPDQVHTIKLKGRVALDISDGGAVNIIHNGRDRGVPGDLGKPKKVTIP